MLSCWVIYVKLENWVMHVKLEHWVTYVKLEPVRVKSHAEMKQEQCAHICTCPDEAAAVDPQSTGPDGPDGPDAAIALSSSVNTKHTNK